SHLHVDHRLTVFIQHLAGDDGLRVHAELNVLDDLAIADDDRRTAAGVLALAVALAEEALAFGGEAILAAVETGEGEAALLVGLGGFHHAGALRSKSL